MKTNLKHTLTLAIVIILNTGCSPASPSTPEPVSATEEATLPETFTATLPPPTKTLTPSPLPPTETPTSTPTQTPSPNPTVETLKANVNADKLICRYGPGANYLYLIAFNRSTPLKLIGRTEGINNWVLVENGQQDCWSNSEFITLKEEGSLKALPIVYPYGYKIPVSPYYGPTTVLSTHREGDQVTISWMEVIVSPGKYEDANMFPYIVEIWYCKEGEIHFDTLGSRVPFITFTDQSGCSEPSRGRVYIQEKHGYAGPADIPWPTE